MTITVVICSYKYGHLAAQAVESVLNQTRKPDRILFVDDGVGDCRHIERLYPEVEFMERPENLGIVENFNDLLNRVETDKVMFLGADNYLDLETLSVLENFEEDIISYDIAVFGSERDYFMRTRGITQMAHGMGLWRFQKGNILETNYIHGSSLYDVTKAKKVGYKASGGQNTEEDWYLFKGMIQNGATHRHIPEPLLFYRRHRENFHKI